jgi:hypothetical protein
LAERHWEGETMAGRYELTTLAASLALTALSASAQSVEETMRRMHASLARVPHVSDSDLLSDERSARFAAARRFIHEKQCASGRANPVLLSAVALRMNLYGNVHQDGRVTVAPIAGGTQPFELPLRFSTLADFPREYLKDMSALIETRGLPEELTSRLRAELPENYAALTARVEKLMNAFQLQTCSRYVRRDGEGPYHAIFVPPTY